MRRFADCGRQGALLRQGSQAQSQSRAYHGRGGFDGRTARTDRSGAEVGGLILVQLNRVADSRHQPRPNDEICVLDVAGVGCLLPLQMSHTPNFLRPAAKARATI